MAKDQVSTNQALAYIQTMLNRLMLEPQSKATLAELDRLERHVGHIARCQTERELTSNLQPHELVVYHRKLRDLRRY